jgi:hypothetical protein
MALIIVEREFETPQVFETLQAKEDAQAWCLEENGVEFARTYFSIDRTRMVCFYVAPDAEAVRRTQRTAELSYTRIFAANSLNELTGRVVPTSDSSKVLVIVERSFPPSTQLQDAIQMVRDAAWCYDTNDVDVIDSYLPLDMSRSLCVFGAPDVESVRRANRVSGLPFTRVWAATLHEKVQEHRTA